MSGDKRGWRLLVDLNNAFRKDPNIDEFDFVPVTEPKQNRSPIILVDHKLGIELWSVKILYLYAYQKLLDWRSKKSTKFIEPQELIQLTRAVLLINPECATAWNIRKELIESGDISLLDDLKIGAVILTKHPKSSETFIHRRWVLSIYIENHLQSSQNSTRSTGSTEDGFISMEAIDLDIGHLPQQNGIDAPNVESRSEYYRLMKSELEICQRAASKYPSNYYAWSHRIWLLQRSYNCSLQVLLSELQGTETWICQHIVLLSELQGTETWVCQHISDCCGFHYRQFLLSSLEGQKEVLRQQFSVLYLNLLQKEYNFVLDLIQSYQAHESMWNHRRFVVYHLHMLYQSENTTMQLDINDSTANTQQKKTRLENDACLLVEKEIDSVKKINSNTKKSFQSKLASDYLKWISRTVPK